MRIGLRANASMAIGTGHVMRQIALAQHLISEEVETFLFASIPGPSWLRQYVAGIPGLNWLEVEESNFSSALFQDQVFDAIVIDSYALRSPDLRKLESVAPRIAVVVDGAWQELSGMVGIFPTLDPAPPGIADIRGRFDELYFGPEFIMLRNEVLEAGRIKPVEPRRLRPHIVVAVGGADSGHLTERIIELLEQEPFSADITVFGGREHKALVKPVRQITTVTRKPSGAGWLDELATASLAVVGAGTSVAEVAYLRTPAVFLAVADNQWDNARVAESLGFGKSVFIHDPDWENLFLQCVDQVLDQSDQFQPEACGAGSRVDEHGVERVFQALLGSKQISGAR